MTDLAGCFFRVKKVSLDRRSMGVMTYPALIQPNGIVSMDLGEGITLMAIETAAFKHETAPPIQPMALSALHARNRRMLVKRLKGLWRIRTHKEMYLLLAAFPQQNQRVQANRRLQCGVKHIRKWLLGL